MKNLYRNIRLRMEIPSGIDILVAAILTVICGNITGEIVSRPINSYVQAACMLLTAALGIITLRMIALWIYEYVTNKNK
jgi:uncharacterized membrane protein YoaK (UPF0700 family)